MLYKNELPDWVKVKALTAQGVEVARVPVPAEVEVTYLIPEASKRLAMVELLA